MFYFSFTVLHWFALNSSQNGLFLTYSNYPKVFGVILCLKRNVHIVQMEQQTFKGKCVEEVTQEKNVKKSCHILTEKLPSADIFIKHKAY